VESRLGEKNWLFGPEPSFTDIAILPFVRQFRIAGETWFDTELALPAVRSWLFGFLEAEFFTAVMAKHRPWVKNDPVVFFP
jgi:glutathione S-transferase